MNAKPVTFARAHESLRDELIAAIRTDPVKIVRTPGFTDDFNQTEYSAADVLLDAFSGDSGTASLVELLRIVGRASLGQDVTIASQLWLSTAAERHAKFHADDLVHRQLEAA